MPEVNKSIPKEWFRQEDVVMLSKRLLGCKLATTIDGVVTSGIIVETEAYNGENDAACHAHLGKHTKRTAVMYQPGGLAYIYLCYGVYLLFNIVTGEAGNPQVILIRALEPLEGQDIMQKRRHISDTKRLCKGPGALCQALRITKEMNELPVTEPPFTLFFGDKIAESQIATGVRIGIGVGKDENLPYRFWLRDSAFVSSHRKESL